MSVNNDVNNKDFVCEKIFVAYLSMLLHAILNRNKTFPMLRVLQSSSIGM